jgi:hypothetical protein
MNGEGTHTQLDPEAAVSDAPLEHFDGYPAGLVEGRPLFARLLDAVLDGGLTGERGAEPDDQRELPKLSTGIHSPASEVEKGYVGYWFRGPPSPHRLWEDLGVMFPRLKPHFDPTTPQATTAWKAAVANGAVPTHR